VRQATLTRVSKSDGRWQDGRRAWEGLGGWFSDAPTPRASRPNRQDAGDGNGALNALLDIAQLRHLLDQAELVAVRSARKHRKSWAEIATKLGVTRQSAWERWRNLDDETVSERTGDASAEVIEPAAKELRRRSSVVVPG